MYECTVSELNNLIKNVIDDKVAKEIKLTGELSSVKNSGKHAWLTIKDNSSTMSCVFWNCDDFSHQEGDKVIITGKLTYYFKNGNINFIGNEIELLGVGELYKQYQLNYKKFEDKGYFDNKKKLPETINSIGVLTAKNGDALQDLLHVLRNNNFGGTVYVYNCPVQGINCSKSIVDGMKYFKKHQKNVDVLLLTRGGGSLEDLIGFSDIDVVESINKCKFYTISAIGHQADNMLSDFVANHRSATPSIAGKDISECHLAKLNHLQETSDYLEKCISDDVNYINISLQKLYRLHDKLPDITNSIDWEIENLKSIDTYYYNIIRSDVIKYKNELSKLKNKVIDNSHENILSKGYVLLLDSQGKIVNTSKEIKRNKNLKIHLSGKELNVVLAINN